MRQKSILTLLGTLAICTPIIAQQPPDQPQGPPPDNGQGNSPDGPMHGPPRGPGQMLEHLKHELSPSDEEWTTISPKIKTILSLEHELYAGGGGPPPRPPGDGDGDGGGGAGGGGAGGGGGGADGGPPDGNGNANVPPATQSSNDSSEAEALRKAKRALGDLIHQSDANADDVAAALKTIRAARVAARTALTAAQSDLKPLVNPAQEAILVAFGILE